MGEGWGEGRSHPTLMKGIIPPLVTPLSDRDTLDVAGLERLIEHLISGGVSGLFILGTTGEGPSLSYRLRRELIERTCKQTAGRVPVLVGITDTSFTESVNLARYSADCGATHIVAAPPYYFPAAPPELQEYIQDLVAEMPLPMFLYNMPGLTKVSFEIDLVRRALDMPGVCGVKDSSCDMIYFHRLIEVAKQRADWSVLVGPEELTAEAVLLGGHGGINGGANLHPRLYVQMYEAAARQDLQATRELHAQVMQLAGMIYTVGRHKSAIIKGIKCALSLLGVCEDGMAEPFHRFNEPERQMIKGHLQTLNLLA
jgi:dihydrodipicolinate synthase/N-acetylneuraminate lyase